LWNKSGRNGQITGGRSSLEADRAEQKGGKMVAGALVIDDEGVSNHLPAFLLRPVRLKA